MTDHVGQLWDDTRLQDKYRQRVRPTWDRGLIRRHRAGVHRVARYVQHRRRRVVLAGAVTLALLAAAPLQLASDAPVLAVPPVELPTLTLPLLPDWPLVDDRPVAPASRHLRPPPLVAVPAGTPAPPVPPAPVRAGGRTSSTTTPKEPNSERTEQGVPDHSRRPRRGNHGVRRDLARRLRAGDLRAVLPGQRSGVRDRHARPHGEGRLPAAYPSDGGVMIVRRIGAEYELAVGGVR